MSESSITPNPLPGQITFDEYQSMYQRSINEPGSFWSEQAHKFLRFFQDFDVPFFGSFERGDVAWFLNGKLNACYNCIDQHLQDKADKIAIIWEGDEPGMHRKITYYELFQQVCRIANAMKASGIQRGDIVTIYMPMIPEVAMVMLACARIGAPHSVVFAGFSADSLRDRINDGNSKWVFTTDEGRRGGKTLPLKRIVDEAISGVNCVERVFVFKRTGGVVPFQQPRDIWMDELIQLQRPYCPAEVMDSEDLLFILYTSGSTGKPKGVAHSIAGYLLYTAMTTKYIFNIQDDSIYACVADCGWITGHSYIVYGPLINGATTVMFESTPLYPDHGRYWDLVQTHRISHFYTAPTAIRSLMRFGSDILSKYDRSSLLVLGTVGEPINPEAWRWYYEDVGESRCSIADTWWQTETGGHMCAPLAGITPMKPGSCSFPFFGIELAILDSDGNELEGNNVEGLLVVKRLWPSIARTIYGDHQRYLNVYMKPFPGFYFTGDGCRRDDNGFYWITGRVDDVLNTSGHRIGTAEIESALVVHHFVSEAAVIGFPHCIKGQGICCYIILIEGVVASQDLIDELKQVVRAAIGPFATPDLIIPTPALPKTRSGKIMRRVLRKLACGEEEQLGDLSTLADSSIVSPLIEKVKTALQNYSQNAK